MRSTTTGCEKHHLFWIGDNPGAHADAGRGHGRYDAFGADTAAIAFNAAAGDRLKLQLDEVLAGTPTVDGVIIVNPIL